METVLISTFFKEEIPILLPSTNDASLGEAGIPWGSGTKWEPFNGEVA